MNTKESYDEYIRRMRKLRIEKLRAKARMKQHLIVRSSLQAKAAKTSLIEKGKGKNGKSMSKELLESHFAVR